MAPSRAHQKTNGPDPSLPAQVGPPVANSNPGGHMSTLDGSRAGRHRQPEPTLFGVDPVADTGAITEDTEGLVRHDAADTSRSAARLVQIRTGTQRARVLIYLVQRGPATDPEIGDALGLSPNSERPRRVELVSGGYVADSGAVRQHHGSDHVLWSATDAGRAAAGELAGAA